MEDDGPDRDRLRKEAAEEVELCGVDLQRVGGLFGTALQAHASSWFTLGKDLLSDASSPKTWVQNGVASWIRCYETQLNLYRGICEVASPSQSARGPDERPVLRDGDLHLALDFHAEGTDPFETPIPPGQINNVQVAKGDFLAPHIRLTLSADGKTVLLGLVGLGAPRDPLPPGRRRITTLVWPGGSMKVIAHRHRENAG